MELLQVIQSPSTQPATLNVSYAENQQQQQQTVLQQVTTADGTVQYVQQQQPEEVQQQQQHLEFVESAIVSHINQAQVVEENGEVRIDTSSVHILNIF